MFPKPQRGEFLMERRQKQRQRKADEDSIMQAAKRRDSFTCRVPWCEYDHLPVDACHEVHRGMGGNPKGDRTTKQAIITLCRVHHGQYDSGNLKITPVDKRRNFDGDCRFDWESI